LASKHKIGFLVLLSAFISLKETIKHFIGKFFHFFVKERFENLKLMKEISSPTFLLHGAKDKKVPYQHS